LAEAAAPETPGAEASLDESADLVDETVSETEDAPAVLTPILAVGRSRYAVAGLGVVALTSLLGALEISKRPRRRTGQLEPVDGGGLQ
jgi:hypothetical protein